MNEQEKKQAMPIPITKRALLMEDDEACQKIMGYFLQRLDYQVDLVDGGIKAIQSLYCQSYDLIIADIRLNGMSGREVIQYVRDSEFNAGTPVIVWSAFLNKNNEKKYLAWGADGALIKACSYRELEDIIQQCFLTPRYERSFIYRFKTIQKNG